MDTRNSKFHQGFVWKVREVESFRFKKCSQNFLGSLLRFQDVGILPPLVISILRVVWLSFNALNGLFGRFFPKGLFGKLMGYGNSALFDPI